MQGRNGAGAARDDVRPAAAATRASIATSRLSAPGTSAAATSRPTIPTVVGPLYVKVGLRYGMFGFIGRGAEEIRRAGAATSRVSADVAGQGTGKRLRARPSGS